MGREAGFGEEIKTNAGIYPRQQQATLERKLESIVPRPRLRANSRLQKGKQEMRR